jgi:hypothetical protein
MTLTLGWREMSLECVFGIWGIWPCRVWVPAGSMNLEIFNILWNLWAWISGYTALWHGPMILTLGQGYGTHHWQWQKPWKKYPVQILPCIIHNQLRIVAWKYNTILSGVIVEWASNQCGRCQYYTSYRGVRGDGVIMPDKTIHQHVLNTHTHTANVGEYTSLYKIKRVIINLQDACRLIINLQDACRLIINLQDACRLIISLHDGCGVIIKLLDGCSVIINLHDGYSVSIKLHDRCSVIITLQDGCSVIINP